MPADRSRRTRQWVAIASVALATCASGVFVLIGLVSSRDDASFIEGQTRDLFARDAFDTERFSPIYEASVPGPYQGGIDRVGTPRGDWMGFAQHYFNTGAMGLRSGLMLLATAAALLLSNLVVLGVLWSPGRRPRGPAGKCPQCGAAAAAA